MLLFDFEQIVVMPMFTYIFHIFGSLYFDSIRFIFLVVYSIVLVVHSIEIVEMGVKIQDEIVKKVFGKVYKPSTAIEWRAHHKTNRQSTALHNQRGFGIQDSESVDLRFGRRWSRWGIYNKY